MDRMGAPVEQTALGRFFVDHLDTHRSDTILSFFLHLPEIYKKAGVNSALNLAVAAAAEVNFANRHDLPEMRVAAADKYGQVVKQLQNDVADPRLAKSDELLVTTLLLGAYEVC